MKKTLLRKLLPFLLILCLCLPALTACSGGIDRSDAKLFAEDFFAAVAAEDYETAETFLHPDCAGDLSIFLLNAETRLGVKFGDGIEIVKHTGFSYSFYNSAVDGSQYIMNIETKVGEQTVNFSVTVVQNDAGYGIYDLVVGE